MTTGLTVAAENDFAETINFIPLATLICDPHGLARAVNPAWASLSGTPVDRSLGAGWVTAVTEPARPRLLETLHRVARSGGHSSLEVEIEVATARRWTRWTLVRHLVGDGAPAVVMVVVDIDAERVRELNLRRQATHDSLTGLVNRAEFLHATADTLARTGGPAGVIFADLDWFKHVNDRGGHLLGDQVLSACGRRFRAAVRPGDTVGRVGGDEFAVLCPDISDPAELEVVAARLRNALSTPIEASGHMWPVGVTTGVAVSEPGQDAESLLDAADREMYAAKQLRCRPGPRAPGLLPVAAAEVGEQLVVPVEVVNAAIQRIYGVSLTLAACAEASTGPSAERLAAAVDDLDSVVSGLRTAGYSAYPKPHI